MNASARRLLSLSVAASLPVLVGFARAEPERVRLQFRAEGECPSEETFRRQVLSRTGDIQFESERPTRVLEISVVAVAASDAWGELRFHRPGEEGTSRRIQDETCAGVVSALALVAVLAIDPRATELSLPEPRGMPSDSRLASWSAAPEVPLPAAHRSAGSTALSFGALAGVEAFTPESPTLSIGLAAAFELGLAQGIRPALRLGGRLGTSALVESGPGEAQFRTALAFLEVSPARLQLGAVEVSGWGGVEVGQLAAEGVSTGGLEQSGRATVPWVALFQMARFGLDWGAGWHGELEIGLVEPLRRDRFFFEQPYTLVHAVPALGAIAGLGAGYHFF